MEQLALFGGAPVLDHAAMPEELFRWPIFTEEDEAAVLDILKEEESAR